MEILENKLLLMLLLLLLSLHILGRYASYKAANKNYISKVMPYYLTVK